MRVVDVTLFYGKRSGGIRTYLEAKAEYAARSGAFEHHLVIPTEQRSLRIVSSNGYRVPLGPAGLGPTIRELSPHVVLLHDPYWTPRLATRVAHEVGASVVAVHHSSAALHAAGLPGPDGIYARALGRWYRRAYRDVDAIMTVVDPEVDVPGVRLLPLRLGVDPAFHPRLEIPRGDHVLYVGRLAREKGLRELLEAASGAPEPWPLTLVGTGPAEDCLRDRARQLGLADRISFRPFLASRQDLAEAYAGARCVVLPGAHETFGLVALEAAACGVPVVTARATPSSTLLGRLGGTFVAGDAEDLTRAITRARRLKGDPELGWELARDHAWDAALSAELRELESFVGAARACA